MEETEEVLWDRLGILITYSWRRGDVCLKTKAYSFKVLTPVSFSLGFFTCNSCPGENDVPPSITSVLNVSILAKNCQNFYLICSNTFSCSQGSEKGSWPWGGKKTNNIHLSSLEEWLCPQTWAGRCQRWKAACQGEKQNKTQRQFCSISSCTSLCWW